MPLSFGCEYPSEYEFVRLLDGRFLTVHYMTCLYCTMLGCDCECGCEGCKGDLETPHGMGCQCKECMVIVLGPSQLFASHVYPPVRAWRIEYLRNVLKKSTAKE